MTNKEFDAYLVSIGGLVRTYKEHKGPILDSGWFQVNTGWYDMLKNLIDELIEPLSKSSGYVKLGMI